MVLINSEQAVGDALRTLATAHVLSAPLVLRTAKPPGSYMVLAFISIGDFLRAFVERAQAAVPHDASLLARMAALSALGRDFCAGDVIALHASDDGDVVYRGATHATTLLELVRSGFLRMPFQRPALAPRHRVGVFDEHGAITDIISMSNLVAWVHARADRLGSLAHRTLAELGLAGALGASSAADMPPAEAVVTVPTAMPTLLAFSALVHNEVSAVGIVDAHSGALVANLSESDFRGFGQHDFGGLALPVGEYLVHKRNLSVSAAAEGAGEGAAAASPRAQSQPQSQSPGARAIHDPWAQALHAGGAAITLPPDATLFAALETLVATRVHRLYVADPATLQPLAVVSHTDILRVLLRGHKPTA